MRELIELWLTRVSALVLSMSKGTWDPPSLIRSARFLVNWTNFQRKSTIPLLVVPSGAQCMYPQWTGTAQLLINLCQIGSTTRKVVTTETVKLAKFDEQLVQLTFSHTLFISDQMLPIGSGLQELHCEQVRHKVTGHWAGQSAIFCVRTMGPMSFLRSKVDEEAKHSAGVLETSEEHFLPYF